MTIYGLDIGNAFAYASVLEVDPRNPGDEHKDPLPMLPGALSNTGIPTDAYISPEGVITIGQGRSRPADAPPFKKGLCGVVRAVKTILLQDEVVCRLPRKLQVTVKTGDIYAAIIRETVTVANEHRREIGLMPIYDIMLAVPSTFADPETSKQLISKVHACVESIELDGRRLTLHGTIPEPAAVALDYLHYRKFMVPPAERPAGDEFTVAVYDIGQGTFDTSLTRINTAQGSYELLRHVGAPIGGKDLDNTLREYFLAQLRRELQDDPQTFQNVQSSDRLYVTANEVKSELSATDEVEREYLLPTGDSVSLTVTREAFEQMIASYIEQTLEMVQELLDYAEDKGVKVDCIVLSGGCSQIPFVVDMVRELADEYGLRIDRYRPSQAVSFGAARHAWKPETLEKYTGYDYSIRLEEAGNLHGRLLPVIPFNSKLPFTTPPITLSYQHMGVYWVCRTLDKADLINGTPLWNYRVLRKMKVNILPGEQFKAVFTMDEEYMLHIECRRMNGELLLKL